MTPELRAAAERLKKSMRGNYSAYPSSEQNLIAVDELAILDWAVEQLTSPEQQTREELLDVIREVHSQHADDLCLMPADVNRIFEAAGLPPQDLRVGDKAAMLKNCERYVNRLQSGGPWKSYAELEAENARLRRELEHALLGRTIEHGSTDSTP